MIGEILDKGVNLQDRISLYNNKINSIKEEFSKIVVGQTDVIEKLLISLICKGHVLVEGVPGIAKTLIAKTFARINSCTFSRIQFTPDLLPTDITGVMTYDETKKFHVLKGPIFANFILADEINRTPPKVQSALLEGMQERQVTIGKQDYPLPIPFFVMATQNPIETLGTYNLPEAQLDRFLFKLNMTYPDKEEEEVVLNKNISSKYFEDFSLHPVVNKEEILVLQEDIHNIYVDKQLEKYIVNIVDATRNPDNYQVKMGNYIELGASPRASISMYIAAKANALLRGRDYVTPHDIKQVAPDVLRHRLIMNYEAQAEHIKVDDVVSSLLKTVVVP